MKRIFRRIGLIFLKWSGWDVPEKIIRNMVEPMVLSTSFSVSSKAPEFIYETAIQNKRNELSQYVKKFITMSEKVDGIMRTLTFEIIVQPSEPEGSKKLPPEGSTVSHTLTSQHSDGQHPFDPSQLYEASRDVS